MRHFFLSLLILLTCLAWGRPLSTFGAAQKPATTRHGSDERKKNTAATTKNGRQKTEDDRGTTKNQCPC